MKATVSAGTLLYYAGKSTHISAVYEVGAPDAQLQAHKKIIGLVDVVAVCS